MTTKTATPPKRHEEGQGQLPIIVWPLYHDSLPQWLKEQILKDRMSTEDSEAATDSEALAYLMGASLAMPLGHGWSNVFFHCFTKVMKAAGKEIPPDLERRHLDMAEQEDLLKLRKWIRRKQDNFMREKNHDNKRQRPCRATSETKKQEER